MAKKALLSENAKRVISLVLGGVCSALVLAFSVLTIIAVSMAIMKRLLIS